MSDMAMYQRPRLAIVPDARPFIDLFVSQLDELKRQLDQRGIGYWVDPWYLSFNHGPETALVHLDRGVDVVFIQSVLDRLPRPTGIP